MLPADQGYAFGLQRSVGHLRPVLFLPGGVDLESEFGAQGSNGFDGALAAGGLFGIRRKQELRYAERDRRNCEEASQRSGSLPSLHNQGFRVVFSLGVDSLNIASGLFSVSDYHDNGLMISAHFC